MERIYLDYAAATPLDKRVFDAMLPYFSEKYGNANAIHSFGQEAQRAVDDAKETLARELGAERGEVCFTPSASASNKLVLEQTVRRALDTATFTGKPNIIISSIEHNSVRDTAYALEEQGVEVKEAPVLENGIVDVAALGGLLNERTVLVSVIYVNNEIGTVEPIAEIAKIIRDFKTSKFEIQNSKLETAYPLFHTDASHAPQYLPCDVRKLGVDALTLSPHKICGPKGIGVLYTKGGAVQPELQKSTANVPAIVGCAEAVAYAAETRERESERMTRLLEYFIRGVKEKVGNAELNGVPDPRDGARRVPHIASVFFPGRDGEELLIKLDMEGVAVSTGAACAARTVAPSHVIRALGFGESRAKSTLRFSFGRETTEEHVREALERLGKIL